jgi:DNA polymerase-3 subunit delta'
VRFLDFPELQGNEQLKKSLSELERGGRMPHAVIISSGNAEGRRILTKRLSMWAVCSKDNPPCGKCKDCQNVQSDVHCDVYFAKGSGKTDIYKKEEIAAIIRDSYVKPNQALRKVYVFEDCDRKLPVISQNAFLKTLEEPPQDTLFILTCESSRSLLDTIRSRAVEFSLENTEQINEEAYSLAKEIARGIVSPGEINLLRSTYKMNDRALALDTLDSIAALLRDGLAVYIGSTAEIDSDTADLLCRKLTKSRFLKLIELTQDAKSKVYANVSLKLISLWLCAEYRRNVWQK